jgi:hypothetical protein
VVILLLGVGMGGLFWWRSSQEPPVVVAPSPSVSAALAAAHTPPVESVDIPPPPVIPDAAPSASVKVPVSSGGVGGDGCGVTTCNGDTTVELSNSLAFRAKTAHKCYDEALAQDPTLKGTVVIHVRVSYNGTVCAASVESSDVANPSVAACIANKFRQGARLASPKGGCMEANVPVKLLPPH